MLNFLLGRLGLDIYLFKTEVMSNENEIIQTKEVNGFKLLGDKLLVNYKNKVNRDICEELDVDFKNTVFNNLKLKTDNQETFDDVSIAIVSAVTSYARMHISKVKLDILKRGGGIIYYTDTDSIVTNTPLPSNITGEELGLFKLEHLINKGYFISSKTYCLITDNSSVIKAKGVNKPLTEAYFIELYKGDSIKTERSESNRNYSEGYVNIKQIKPIIL
jgi:hypothetical protein